MKKRVYRDKYYNKEITKTETGVKVEPVKKMNKKKSDK